ncbi:sigma-G-dependent sporulation-specific acid-soluble spore protein CsgA [Peribacillus simplex]|uniref:sigma-G-dependent sporulation-specific acid-soluble spore protein CsgA n=1 Tax=Peribacillus simplex TaxID=1478 RepID=UPI003CF7CDE7
MDIFFLGMYQQKMGEGIGGAVSKNLTFERDGMMDRTIGYLREILSNYTDQYPEAQEIYNKIKSGHFHSEEELVNKLSDKEARLLNHILPQEIKHAKEVSDTERVSQLSEVYELIII